MSLCLCACACVRMHTCMLLHTDRHGEGNNVPFFATSHYMCMKDGLLTKGKFDKGLEW